MSIPILGANNGMNLTGGNLEIQKRELIAIFSFFWIILFVFLLVDTIFLL